VPLNIDKLNLYGMQCILDILNDTLGILSDIFVSTRVESPYKNSLFEKPAMLSPGMINESLFRRWKTLSEKDPSFSPCAYIYGLCYVYALTVTGMSRALMPGALNIWLDSKINAEKPCADINILTFSDIWLERTINNSSNLILGALNAEMLSEKLHVLENRLCGKIVKYNTAFKDDIRISKYEIKRI
jgi:hypothetical protein